MRICDGMVWMSLVGLVLLNVLEFCSARNSARVNSTSRICGIVCVMWFMLGFLFLFVFGNSF